MQKIVIYTAITNNKDSLREPISITPNAKYVCFSDIFFKSDIWEYREIPKLKDKHIATRYCKLNPHLCLPDHDISVWHDGSFTSKNLTDLLSTVNEDFFCHKHSVRTNVYEEEYACVRLKKDSPAIMRHQIKEYKERGLPTDSNLFETGILIRKNTKMCRLLNEFWWKEVENKSIRDQLSLPYVLWRHKFPYQIANTTVYNNPYFDFKSHGEQGYCRDISLI